MRVSSKSTSRKKLRTLIVGCGAIAGGYDESSRYPEQILSHAGAYRAHGGFELAACVDPDAKRRAAFAAHWQVRESFADLKTALAAGSYDVVSLCGPDSVHDAHLKAVLGASAKAVFCEKPMTANARGGARLVRAFAERGTLLAVDYTRRFEPSIRALALEIAEGKWGRLQNADARYGKGIRHNGCHLLNLLQLLAGPLRFEQALSARSDHAADDPTVDAVLRTKDGAPIVLLGADSRHFALFEVELLFERGHLRIEDSGFRLTRREARKDSRFPAYRTLGKPRSEATELSRALLHAVGNLYDAVVKGAALLSDADGAVAAESLADRIRRAGLDLLA
jgi:predicted dehydrogenase